MFYLSEELKNFFSDSDPYKVLEELDGNVYREVKNRKTLQFDYNGKSYFAKIHTGVGWIEILKNLIQFKNPVIGAKNEWSAIKRLRRTSIKTMTVVAYGEKGWNPAKRQSFIITEDLQQTISLEDYCVNWLDSRPQLSERKALICKVAEIASVLHSSGICHRDLYLCHFLLHKDEPNFPKISVIDLHRALIRGELPKRWVIKDIAGLYYSALNIGRTRWDIQLFIWQYGKLNKNYSFRENSNFWMQVKEKAMRMYKKLGPAR